MFSHEEYEADDFSGSLAKKFEDDIQIYIMSKDMDYLQLVTNHTRILMPTSKSMDMYSELGFTKEEVEQFNIPKNVFEFTPMYVKHFYGVEPENIVDLKAIEGDTSDNIPGVPRVGPKSAIPLIQEFGAIENIYEFIESHLEDVDESLIKKEYKELDKFFKDSLGIGRSPLKHLLEHKDLAFLSKTLATIKTDIDEIQDLKLDDLEFNIDKSKVNEIFERLGMKSLILK